MGIYTDRILPRIADVALSGRDFTALRAKVAAGLSGDVLEVGFGSGRNVAHYPASVERVLAVEPAGGARKLAARRIAVSPVPVEFVGLDGEELPLDDTSVDHVLTTWTLCSIPDVARALREMLRVLRPGGALHLAEHGRSPDPGVARWQDRLTPLQRRLAGGCHLNRPIAELVGAAGFEPVELETSYLRGPKPFGYTYAGRAMKPATELAD